MGLLTTAGGWTGVAGFAGALVVGILASAVWALLIGGLTLRLREDYLAITTIAAGEILRLVINNETEWTRGPAGLQTIPFPFEGARILVRSGLLAVGGDPRVATNLTIAVVALLALGITAWLLHRILRSPWGRRIRAVRDDEDAAAGLGAPVVRFKMQALVIGSGVAGLSGALWAWHRLQLVPVMFDPLPTFYAWSILILGGLGSLRGVVAGSAVFWAIYESPRWIRIAGLGSEIQAPLQVALIGLLLMVLVLVRPEGLFGSRAELEATK